MLSVTRAFGDPYFKVPRQNDPTMRKVIAVPEFTSFSVGPEDFLFLSCDGIYEASRPSQAFNKHSLVNWIATRLETTRNLGVVCGMVLNECLIRGSTDNMSAMLVKFEDGGHHISPVPTFLPGPTKIPSSLRPTVESQRLFLNAYTANAKALGYTYEEAREIRKKLGPKKFL
eukprot:TRINITY_DN4794_c0_g1_i11.p1 TRINITY_DN4794_c0_g1~~TRINITY_DN4794_c0_g1_i11.p1  ORF type:complete len:172 (+),score=37.18 TRINITY_DN4794_c0_g1_i11:808-1323(+)